MSAAYNHASISHPDDDQLGWREFVRHMAAGIAQIDVASGGYVIGITGEWGHGKTSLINLILLQLRHLEMADRSTVGVYYGDPCNSLTTLELDELARSYSRVESLVEEFDSNGYRLDYTSRGWLEKKFSEVLGDDKTAEKVYRYFRLLRYCETNPKNLIVRFSPWLITNKADLATALLSEIERASAGVADSLVTESLRNYRRRLIELGSLTGAVIDSAGGLGLGAFAAGGMKLFLEESDRAPTLEEARSKLSFALRRRTHSKIIVVVDDLDRLTPIEAVEMTSVLRGVTDLPNVLHILAYDEARFSQLIQKCLKCDGSEYLEKIVQLKKTLPPLEASKLRNLFGRNFLQILKSSWSEEAEDVKDRNLAWNLVLSYYLRSPRSIIRLLDGIQFSYAAIKDYTYLVDLLLLENFQYNEPSIYKWICDNRDVLTDAIFQRTDETIKEKLETVLEGVRHKEACKNGLKILFPRVDKAYGGGGSSGGGGGKTKRRVQFPEFFDTYFNLTPGATHLPVSRLAEVKSSQDPTSALQSIIVEIENAPEEKQSNLRRMFLEDLADHFGPNTPMSLAWLSALVNHSPYFISERDFRNDFFMSDNEMLLESAVVRGIDPLGGDGGKILFELLEQDPPPHDLSLICDVVRTMTADEHPEGAVDRTNRLGNWAARVRAKLRDQIRKLADRDELWTQADPTKIIWFWWSTNDLDGLRNFLSRSLKSEANGDRILTAFISDQLSSAHGRSQYVNLKSIASMIDPVELEEYAKKLLSSKLEKNREVANRFLEALNRSKAEEN